MQQSCTSHNFYNCGKTQKERLLNTGCSSWNFLSEDQAIKKCSVIQRYDNFGVNLKNLIGVGFVIWVKTETEQYFVGTNKQFFRGK